MESNVVMINDGKRSLVYVCAGLNEQVYAAGVLFILLQLKISQGRGKVPFILNV